MPSESRGLIESGKAKPEDFHVPFLEFVLQMIDVGPTSSHVEYISNLNDSSVEFYKYLSVSAFPTSTSNPWDKGKWDWWVKVTSCNVAMCVHVHHLKLSSKTNEW